jgi:hypothetical protein
MRSRGAIAHHEAAHAVVARELGLSVTRVEIFPEQEPTGLTESQSATELERSRSADPARVRAAALKDCVKNFAGYQAELKFSGDAECFEHAADDWERVCEYSATVSTTELEARRLRDEACEQAKRLIEQPEIWSKVTALATALTKKSYLEATEIESLLHPDWEKGQKWSS